MAVVRAIARPMLSAIFVAGGINQLRSPGPHTKTVEPVTDLVSRSVPRMPSDTETLIRINGATQVGAGVLFALGKFPRLSALALAATLVPTTAGTHRFWEEEETAQRAGQQMHFLKNTGLFGGLLFAAVAGRGGRKRGRRAKRKDGKSAASARH